MSKKTMDNEGLKYRPSGMSDEKWENLKNYLNMIGEGLAKEPGTFYDKENLEWDYSGNDYYVNLYDKGNKSAVHRLPVIVFA